VHFYDGIDALFSICRAGRRLPSLPAASSLLFPSATAFEKRFESSKNQKPRQRITCALTRPALDRDAIRRAHAPERRELTRRLRSRRVRSEDAPRRCHLEQCPRAKCARNRQGFGAQHFVSSALDQSVPPNTLERSGRQHRAVRQEPMRPLWKPKCWSGRGAAPKTAALTEAAVVWHANSAPGT
jgi:hypothetical protein